MKTTLSGYSQFLALLGMMSVLLMLLGISMASSTQTGTGQADGKSSIHPWYLMYLRYHISDLQAEFAKDRLGDMYYDDYERRIAGIPRPPWGGLDYLSKKEYLDKIAKELYIFRKFITEVKNLESQIKNSQYVNKLERIVGLIKRVISNINDVQRRLGYAVTLEPSSPLPTRRPFATMKKQYEWELGVLKSFEYWCHVVSWEFYHMVKQG